MKVINTLHSISLYCFSIQATIQQLKQELEKAWKMVDAATERETRARETIQTLKLEIANLTKLVEQGAGLSMGQEHRYDSQNFLEEIFDFSRKQQTLHLRLSMYHYSIMDISLI